MLVRFVLPLVAFVLLPRPTAAQLVWPGPGACSTTLQACVDAAPAGSVIEVTGPGPVTGGVSFEKSLSLVGVGPSPPQLAPGTSIVGISPPSGDHLIRIENFVVPSGSIAVGQGGTGSLTAEIVGNQVTASSYEAIRLWTGTGGAGRGPTTFAIEGNRLVVPAGLVSQARAIGTDFFFPATNHGVIRDNDIEMGANDQSVAIDLPNGAPTLTLEVIGNRLSGSGFDAGLRLFQFDPAGSISAVVANNLLSGANPGEPGRSGAGLQVMGSEGSVDVQVVNNTVADNDVGLFVSGGAVVTGLIANNAFTDNPVYGFAIESALWSTVANRNNLDAGNGVSGEGPTYDPGPGTVTAPALLDPADGYRPFPGSPVRDAGDPSALPVGLAADLDGRPRIRGATVDIGAYELPEPGAALAGAAALAALAGVRSRRRHR